MGRHQRTYQRTFVEARYRGPQDGPSVRCAATGCSSWLNADRKRYEELTEKGVACDEQGQVKFYCSGCARLWRGKRTDVPCMKDPDIAFLADCQTFARESREDAKAKTFAERWERLWELLSPVDEARVDAELERREEEAEALLRLETNLAEAARKAEARTLFGILEEAFTLGAAWSGGRHPLHGYLVRLVGSIAESSNFPREAKQRWLRILVDEQMVREAQSRLAFVEEGAT